jgi:hypothetical protein
MTNRRYSPDPREVQKGNPHELTRRQHILPVASIDRFCDAKGLVTVVPKSGIAEYKVRCEDPRFTVHRAWDQKSEDLAKTEYEDPFQAVAKELRSPMLRALSPSESAIVSNMYGLWRIRSILADETHDEIELVGMLGPRNIDNQWSQDEGEQLERGWSPVLAGAHPVVVAKRFFAWPRITTDIMRTLAYCRDRKWALIDSLDGEFCVSDRAPSQVVMPLTPTRIAALDALPQSLPRRQVSMINARMREASKHFIFGHSAPDFA